jgi:hypothetical protein
MCRSPRSSAVSWWGRPRRKAGRVASGTRYLSSTRWSGATPRPPTCAREQPGAALGLVSAVQRDGLTVPACGQSRMIDDVNGGHRRSRQGAGEPKRGGRQAANEAKPECDEVSRFRTVADLSSSRQFPANRAAHNGWRLRTHLECGRGPARRSAATRPGSAPPPDPVADVSGRVPCGGVHRFRWHPRSLTRSVPRSVPCTVAQLKPSEVAA